MSRTLDADQQAGIELAFQQVPGQTLASQNYPNPFKPSTEIGYQLSEPGNVSIIIYDVLGKEVVRFVDA